MMFYLYCVTNKNNGKKYVGMTGRNPETRWKAHVSAARQGSPFRFHAAIRKYGIDAWTVEEICTVQTIDEARLKEERLIIEMKTMDSRTGYNAKPGGCGGWIVPADKYEQWAIGNAKRAGGLLNPNSLAVTNEQLIELGLRFIAERGFVPGIKRLRRFAEKNDVAFPQHFTSFRFGGFKKFVDLLVSMSGKEHSPFFRDQEQIALLRSKNLGKRWYHNEVTRKCKQFCPSDVPTGWEIGRKSYA
jgi:hypothetical protein